MLDEIIYSLIARRRRDGTERSDALSMLLAARDGNLWIGTTTELVSWREGQLTAHPEFDGRIVAKIYEDREGVIWADGSIGAANAKLCERGSSARDTTSKTHSSCDSASMHNTAGNTGVCGCCH